MKHRGAARALGGRVRAGLGVCLLAVCAAAAAAEEAAPLRLRYGWSPGQSWRATWSSVRETRVADSVQRDRGTARFEYIVHADASGEGVRLEARLLSQETDAGVSPIDFSAILFRTGIDERGRLRGAHYAIGDVQPPAIEGVARDALSYRQMLRQIASAWRGAAFWFPELPERALAPGEAFVVDEARELAEEEPGVSMRVQSARTYRLLALEQGVARFSVTETSSVDAATPESGIASQQRAEGEAFFDLALGMWTRHKMVSNQQARYSGAPPGVGTGEASSRSVTSIDMEIATPAR